MRGINEVIAEMQFEEKKHELYKDYLFSVLVKLIAIRHEKQVLSSAEKEIIIDACNEAGKHKSEYAIKLLELLDK